MSKEIRNIFLQDAALNPSCTVCGSIRTKILGEKEAQL